jgi:hypothetical protein
MPLQPLSNGHEKRAERKIFFVQILKKTSRQITQNMLTFWAADLRLLASVYFSLQTPDLHNYSTSHISFLAVLPKQF